MSYHNNSQNDFRIAKFRSLLHFHFAAVVAAKKGALSMLPVGVIILIILFALQLNHVIRRCTTCCQRSYIDLRADNSLAVLPPSIDYRKRKMSFEKPELVSSILNKILCSSSRSGTDFIVYAYVYVLQHLWSRALPMKERKPSFKGQLHITSPTVSGLYWDGPIGAALQPDLGPWESGGTACYPSHKFIITKPHHPEDDLPI
jgi:hypothetical protein